MNSVLTQDKTLLTALELIDKSGRETNLSPDKIYQAKKALLLRFEGKSETCAFYPRKRYANK